MADWRMKMKCPFCGSEVESDAKYCYRCGSSLKGDRQSASSYDSAAADKQSKDDYSEALNRANEILNNGGTETYESTYSGDSYSSSGSYSSSSNSNKSRFKNLISALWDSGKLKAALSFLVVLLLITAVICYGPAFFKSRFITVQKNGYAEPADLIESYLKAVTKEKYGKAFYVYPVQIRNYFAQYGVGSPSEIINIQDEAYSAGIYPILKSWNITDETMTWDPDEYYQEDFEEIGLNATEGMDIKVYFTLTDSEDFYIFELIKVKGRWFLLSVYY